MIRCPVCRSTDIYRLVGGYIGEIYRCKRCGYSGSLVIEEDEEHQRKSEG
jgi:transposase-like protein